MSHPDSSSFDPWALFRFSVIGPLLAAPPPKGELNKALKALADTLWQHPIVPGSKFKLGKSTIERWYLKARGIKDPLGSLARKCRNDLGGSTAVSKELHDKLMLQYQAYPGWSYQLHYDNLKISTRGSSLPDTFPVYATLRRYMQAQGWLKQRILPNSASEGMRQALSRREKFEIRRFEATHVHALWHSDFHHGRLRVVDVNGQWYAPIALAFLDDKSRLCCHIQWFIHENASNYLHGLFQAFYKRGLPRALMSDNGGPMTAEETVNGLKTSGVIPDTTLPYSPYQNGKQEVFWASLEGRLVAMSASLKDITLAQLNEFTQAWVELEYNRRMHSELGKSPLAQALLGPSASREAPDPEVLKEAFTLRETRILRRSDGTVSIKGVRFEVPSHLHSLRKLSVRYQSFDLSQAYVYDEHTRLKLATLRPVDKQKNANGQRKPLSKLEQSEELPDNMSSSRTRKELPPLLGTLLADYRAMGIPPAYIPVDESTPNSEHNHED